ncbi:putative ribonuclease H-like domain-containing protein [Tanacetum coccineum]
MLFLSLKSKRQNLKQVLLNQHISQKDILRLPQAQCKLLPTLLPTQTKSYVAMITARIRKFMRKTGRPIDLKPKNGITFDKSKIECFNCQKLGHFARECRFAKYQENRANGRNEKRIVAIEDSNSKALVATDNNEDIDWTKEFDAEPVTFAMMALTEVEQDDWSMEFDAEHVHFGQDGLGDFDWSNKADDTPVSLALMATNSEVPYCSKCSKSYKKLLESYQTERDNFQKARTEILGYQMSLESLEVILKTHEKNEYAWGDKYEQMEYDLKIRDLKLEEKQKELDQALKERDDFKVKLEKWSNASVLQNEVLNKQRYLSDKSCIGFGVESSSGMESDNSSGNTNSTESLYPNFQKTKGFHSVPPPTGTIIPPRANVSFTGIDELAIRNKVLNQENTKSSQPEIDRNKVIIEDWVDSDDEETVLNSSETQKKTVFNSENSETSFENRSPSSQNSVGQESRKTGFGHKGGKLCFVCYSPNHLIKDCNLHERTFIQTQTHKSKGTQGSRDTRPVWNNINRVNHSNFSRNSKYPHQRRSFIPSAVLTREGLKSTARPKWTRTVPSKSTANVFYQGTARPKVPHAVLSQSTGRPYYPRMDNTRPRTSSFSRTPHRPQRPKKIVKSIWVKKGSTVGSQAVLPQTVKESAMIKSNQTWRPKGAYLDSVNRDNGSYTLKQFEYGNPEEDLKDYAIIDSGCSGSMTGDKDKLSDFKEFKGGYVAFGNDSKGGRISGKGTIKTSCIDFEKVSYVEELKFNLLSVSQICDKKHNVLFTDKECLILSPKFKFVDEDLVILRAPRKNDVYSLDLKNIIPSGGITCLVAKATKDEAVLWHRRLGHVNFKNINKLVKGNLVRGLPSKTFKLDHSCLACRKGKQHRASCKKIEERTVREPLELLHMDLFGPVSVESVNRKKYCLVVTDDCSKFSWVFFLAYKDETYDMLHDLIVGFVQLFLNKQLEGVARPQDFIPSVTLPSKIFTFMRKHSPKFSCRITPLTPPMLEGTSTQSAAHASISTAHRYCWHLRLLLQLKILAEVQGDANLQGKLGGSRSKTLSQANRFISWKANLHKETKKEAKEEESGLQSYWGGIRKKDSDVKSGDTEGTGFGGDQSLSIPGPIQSQPQPQQPTQGTDSKDKGKGILKRFQADGMQKKKENGWKKRNERKQKPKTHLSCSERIMMLNFLKGQGYKNFQKLKYPQMKELYDKVQESIKDSFKDFIPIGSEKEREMLKKREAKRLLWEMESYYLRTAITRAKD